MKNIRRKILFNILTNLTFIYFTTIQYILLFIAVKSFWYLIHKQDITELLNKALMHYDVLIVMIIIPIIVLIIFCFAVKFLPHSYKISSKDNPKLQLIDNSETIAKYIIPALFPIVFVYSTPELAKIDNTYVIFLLIFIFINISIFLTKKYNLVFFYRLLYHNIFIAHKYNYVSLELPNSNKAYLLLTIRDINGSKTYKKLYVISETIFLDLEKRK